MILKKIIKIFKLLLKNREINIVKQGIACIPNLQCSEMIRELFEESTDTDIRVECKYNEKFKKWQPLQKTEESISKVDDV